MTKKDEMIVDPGRLSDTIKMVRIQHHYTQQYVATAIGVPRNALVAMELGHRRIKNEELFRLAQVLHYEVNTLLQLAMVVSEDFLVIQQMELLLREKTAISESGVDIVINLIKHLMKESTK